MTERSALNNSPQVASRGQECYDPKNTEENVIDIFRKFIYLISDAVIHIDHLH